MTEKSRRVSKPLSYFREPRFKFDGTRLQEIRDKLEDYNEIRRDDIIGAMIAAQEFTPEDIEFLCKAIEQLDAQKNRAHERLNLRLRNQLKLLDGAVKRRLQQARSDYNEKHIYRVALEEIANSPLHLNSSMTNAKDLLGPKDAPKNHGPLCLPCRAQRALREAREPSD